MVNNIGYNGNPRLRPAHLLLQLNLFQYEEYKKCAVDPIYFIKNYMKIVNLDGGLVPFKLWPYQENMINILHNNRFIIEKCPRQSGKTITTVAYILHHIIFNSFKRAAILANIGVNAREFLGRLQLAYEYLPLWMQQGIIGWNKGDIELENGSTVVARSTTGSALRSGSFTFILLDEFAHVGNTIAEEFYMSAYPTISSGKETKVIISSTPKGMNHFFNEWNKAENGYSDFVPLEVHWNEVPGRDEKWKAETIRNTSEEQFRQEFECEFIGSSATLIHPTKLKVLSPNEPIRKEYDGSFIIFEEPIQSHTYVTVVDTSEGLGSDYSAFSVIDVTSLPYKQIAIYRNNEIPLLIYPSIIYDIATRYNTSYILVEINSIGLQVASTLYNDFAYENLIRVTSTIKGQKISGGFGGGTQQNGLKMSPATKRIGCSNLKSIVENDKLIINDFWTIHELLTFVQQKQSYSAELGNNNTDDLVMTLVNFGWLAAQPGFLTQINTNVRQAIQKDKLKIEDFDLMKIPFVVDDGIDEEKWWMKDQKDAKRNKLNWNTPDPSPESEKDYYSLVSEKSSWHRYGFDDNDT